MRTGLFFLWGLELFYLNNNVRACMLNFLSITRVKYCYSYPFLNFF
jgi:hypothetical protein